MLILTIIAKHSVGSVTHRIYCPNSSSALIKIYQYLKSKTAFKSQVFHNFDKTLNLPPLCVIS